MPKPWRYQFQAVKTPAGLTFISRPFFDRAISTLGDGEPVIVTVEKPQDKRTQQMNRALWGPIYQQVIDGVADEVGYDRGDKSGREHLHEGLLQLFTGTVVDPITKREVAKERSSQMTIERFSAFMEWICRWAATEYGIVVTLPGEQ